MLTAQEAYDEILGILNETPELHNPTSGAACVYYRENPPATEATNCVIGKFFVNHGVDVSQWPIQSIDCLQDSRIPQEYRHLVPLFQAVQRVADSKAPWGAVADKLHEREKEYSSIIAEIDGK